MQATQSKKKRCKGGKATYIGRKERERIAAILAAASVPVEVVNDEMVAKAFARDGVTPKDLAMSEPKDPPPNFENHAYKSIERK